MEEKGTDSGSVPYQKPEIADLNSAVSTTGACTNGSGDNTGTCAVGAGVTGFSDEPEGP